MRRLRAVWRLLRVALHVLHGAAIVRLRFGSLDREARWSYVQWWAAKMLRVAGVRLESQGTPAAGGCLLAINHVSWLDIVAIHAVAPRARFVAKADVRHWPLLHRLIDAAGTLYLERERKRDALRVVHRMGEALVAGELLAVFPEGTTGAGHALLPFHANLLQAAIANATPVQPVALRYADVSDSFSPAVAWVGETTMVQSLWRVARAQGLTVRVNLMQLQASVGCERQALARTLRKAIEETLRTC